MNRTKHCFTIIQETHYDSHSRDKCLKYCISKNEKKVTRVAAIIFLLNTKNIKKPAMTGNKRSGNKVFPSCPEGKIITRIIKPDSSA